MVGLGNDSKDPPLEIDRHEHGAMAEQHFGTAKRQESVRIDGKREATKDAGLRFSVEVHERVATEQQVDLGNRRILEQIQAPEHHGSPQVAIERDAPAVASEVLLSK